MPTWLVSLLSVLAPLVPPLARWLEGRVGGPVPAVAIEPPRVDEGDEEARRAARSRAAAVGGVDVTPVPDGDGDGG